MQLFQLISSTDIKYYDIKIDNESYLSYIKYETLNNMFNSLSESKKKIAANLANCRLKLKESTCHGRFYQNFMNNFNQFYNQNVLPTAPVLPATNQTTNQPEANQPEATQPTTNQPAANPILNQQLNEYINTQINNIQALDNQIIINPQFEHVENRIQNLTNIINNYNIYIDRQNADFDKYMTTLIEYLNNMMKLSLISQLMERRRVMCPEEV